MREVETGGAPGSPRKPPFQDSDHASHEHRAPGDWLPALSRAGFDPARPTLWIAEALLFFLTEDQAAGLLRTLRAGSAPGSRLGVDILSRQLLASPATQFFLSALKSDGIPWLFGTDDPPLGIPRPANRSAGRGPFVVVPAGAARGHRADQPPSRSRMSSACSSSSARIPSRSRRVVTSPSPSQRIISW
jgi:hypothetical protein